ncbi:Metallophosphoesterase 1 [Nymphon striatum]|nr:Metallophosphoesterase 1 [Nymphon striatum]
MLTLKWPSITSNVLKSDVIKFLVIADPQLIGYNEVVLGWFQRWDSDKYLEKTFYAARKHFNPDLIIFLGDIFDQGFKASNEQFKCYIQRFSNLYKIQELEKVAIIPGDNDIGGEGEEIFNPISEKRFLKSLGPHTDFPQQYKFLHIHHDVGMMQCERPLMHDLGPKVVKVNKGQGQVELQKVNVLSKNYTQAKVKKNSLIMAISHIPLIPMKGIFIDKSLQAVSPNVVFSAHVHKSIHVFEKTEAKSRIKFTFPFCENGEVEKLILTTPLIHEIVVPTASYRMGENQIGFGAGVLDINGTMTYTVLWLPSRLKQITVYVIYISIVILFLSVYYMQYVFLIPFKFLQTFYK